MEQEKKSETPLFRPIYLDQIPHKSLSERSYHFTCLLPQTHKYQYRILMHILSVSFGYTAYRIRLAGALVPHAGWLEVFYNGSWGTVCASKWEWWSISSANALVACRQLGFGPAIRSED